jgi:uncharacterized membrane protein YadS
MSDQAFGLFAGTAINDTSSVVAAASIYGQEATNYAVVVKLTRTLMIIPIVLGLAAWVARRERRNAQRSTDGATAEGQPPADFGHRVLRLVPLFLLGFVAAAAANSVGLIPAAAQPALADLAVFLITVALAGIGLSTDLRALRRTGPRPLVLGGLLWLVVMVSSLGLQALTGTI